MEIIHDINEVKPSRRTVALGNFDGLHTGHRAVIKGSFKEGCRSCVLRLVPHPQMYFSSEPLELLMTCSAFEEALEKMGVDELIYLNFSEIHSMTPENFVTGLLIDRLGTERISCGYNYTFGRNALGNTEMLRQLCKKRGVELNVAECIQYEGKPISSSRKRGCIASGNITAATEMLGHYLAFKFEVSDGDHRGHLLGFPTINQEFPEEFIKPRYGVYASATFVNGEWKPSVTNFGIRPTVKIPVPRAETYILDYSGNLYGQRVKVVLLDYMRGEVRFSNLTRLSKQIASDALMARKKFSDRFNLMLVQ